MNYPKKRILNILAITFMVFGMMFFFSSCKKKGCTDTTACNYSPSADKDDGTCNYDCYNVGSSSGGSSSGGSSSSSSGGGGGGLCTNTCTYAYDGVCDDGGPGASYDVCDYGTDCDDCGPRYGSGSSSSGSSSSGSSSSGSSSSSSGGSSSGKVTFYTTSDFGCGNISVTVSGAGTRSISSYYSSGISDCGISGCANFTLSPGTYTYSASCSSYTWGPASFTITPNGCLKYKLN